MIGLVGFTQKAVGSKSFHPVWSFLKIDLSISNNPEKNVRVIVRAVYWVRTIVGGKNSSARI